MADGHLRDYLSVLVPLIEEGRVDYEGESLLCRATVFRPAGRPPQILVAGELGLVGFEAEVEDLLASLAQAGVTDFSGSESTPSPEERERTRALLVRVAPAS